MEHDKLESKEELSHKEYRRDAYKLLSDCYHLPDEELIGKLTGGQGAKIGGIFSDLANFCPGISGIGSLVIDYSKLFVGPYGLLASPYGSLYLEGKSQVMGNSTIDVERRYAEEGLDISLKEAPDHIAIELEFMYFLVFQEIAAFNSHDFDNVARYQSKQKAFLETHLGAWVSEITDKVTEKTETVFYKNLARLTNSFVIEDLKYLCNTPLLAIQDTLLA